MLGYLKDLKEKTWKKIQTILLDRNLKYFEFEFESVTLGQFQNIFILQWFPSRN